jgi:hypothetical protein
MAGSNPPTDPGYLSQGIIPKTNLPGFTLTPSLNTRQVSVAAGTLFDSDGTPNVRPAITVTVTANKTNFIVFNPYNLNVLGYERHTSTTMICLGTATADTTKITGVTQNPNPVVRPTALYRTKAKIANNQNLRILVLGGAATAGVGASTPGVTDFISLLTNPATTNPAYLLPNAAKITVDNRSLSGSNAIYGLAVVGSSIANRSFSQDQPDAAAGYGPYLAARTGVGGQVEQVSNVLRGVDLAIINYPSATANHLVYLENIVIQLRYLGIEVILLTGHETVAAPNTLATIGQQILDIGLNYGCEVVDTWAAVRCGITNVYQSVFANDNVSMNDVGHVIYAQAVLSALDGWVQSTTAPEPLGRRRLTPNCTYAIPENFPRIAETIIQNQWGTNGLVTSLTQNVQNCLPVMFGRTAATSVTALTVGQYLSYSHPRARGLSLLTEASGTQTVFKLQMQNINSVVTDIATFTLTATTAGTTQITELLDPTALDALVTARLTASDWNIADSANHYMPFSFRITCVSGTLNVVCPIVLTDPAYEIAFADIETVGTWATEDATNNLVLTKNTLVTDATNAFAIIPFRGNAVQVALSNSPYAGQIQVAINGLVTDASIELYRTTVGNLYNLLRVVVPPGSNGTKDNSLRPGGSPNIMKITLIGVNGAASATVLGARRLQIHGAWSISS